ncbi:9182_t:CDS:2 [Rhizophagus irregularis]|nr:9182_t:CDS:2 [Rhizophagus irregularis]
MVSFHGLPTYKTVYPDIEEARFSQKWLMWTENAVKTLKPEKRYLCEAKGDNRENSHSPPPNINKHTTLWIQTNYSNSMAEASDTCKSVD